MFSKPTTGSLEPCSKPGAHPPRGDSKLHRRFVGGCLLGFRRDVKCLVLPLMRFADCFRYAAYSTTGVLGFLGAVGARSTRCSGALR